MVRWPSSQELTASQRLWARCVVWLLQVRSVQVSLQASSTNTCWWNLLPQETSRQVLRTVLFEPIWLKLRLLSPFGIYQCMVTFPSWTHTLLCPLQSNPQPPHDSISTWPQVPYSQECLKSRWRSRSSIFMLFQNRWFRRSLVDQEPNSQVWCLDVLRCCCGDTRDQWPSCRWWTLRVSKLTCFLLRESSLSSNVVPQISSIHDVAEQVEVLPVLEGIDHVDDKAES